MRSLRRESWTAIADPTRLLLVLFTVSLLSSPATAGERLARLSSIFQRDVQDVDDDRPRPLSSVMSWWSIPRPARDAARKMAAEQDASVTRCVATEQNERVTYSIYAARRTGLFKRSEFVLTSVTEPSAVARKREKEQTFQARMERLKTRMKFGSSAETTPVNRPVPSINAMPSD